MLFLTDMHDYQRAAAQWVVDNTCGMLMLDMGLGKTVSTLTALQTLVDHFEVTRVLVIAPKRVALSTWPAEIEAWDHIRLSYSLLMGSKAARGKAYRSPAPVHITNIDNLVWLIEHAGKHWPYDMVVIDESSMFKSHNTRRFRALRRALPQIDRTVLLTGTPAPNSLLNLWPQIYLLDSGERLFRTFTGFRDHYFTSDYMGYTWTPKAGAEEDIYHRIGDVCLRMDAADYLDTPERVDITTPCPLPAAARSVYDAMEADELLPMSEGEPITAANAAVLVGKLQQIAGGAVYREGRDWEDVHQTKLDALEDLIEASGGQPLLVAYNYQHDLARLQARFPQARVLDTDPQTVEDWNAREIPLLLAHPKSAGHGLNLQHGGNTLVWFSLTYSLELYQQFNARLHRQGQKEVTRVYHLVAPDTIDEEVMAALQRKSAGQDALLGALRARSKVALGVAA